MKLSLWITRIVALVIGFSPMIAAANALWTFAQLTPTTVLIPQGQGLTVQYQITNQSHKPHTLVMTPQSGISQVTSAGNCGLSFTLGYLNSCTLTLQVAAGATQSVIGGPVVCDQGNILQCYQPGPSSTLNLTFGAPIPPSTTLTASVANLALSINNPGLNPALTGSIRTFSITNTGTNPATNVNYTITPGLPTGTLITPVSCGTIAPGASCVLTVIPGSTASSGISTLTAQGDQTNSIASGIIVLSYGSTYEGGFVFAIDDTTATTGSVGGKVAATSDQVLPGVGVIWSSTISGSYDGGISIWGIDETSTTTLASPNASSGAPATLIAGQANCLGKSDGNCDSTNILVWYTAPHASPAIPATFYAAGLCSVPINGFVDWYLPSICEEGFDSTTAGTGCGTSPAPTLQNMQSNLANSSLGSLSGLYWSSTEYSPSPAALSWSQNFSTSGASTQSSVSKATTLGVRCVRALTQ
jgi:hypothetical protein